MRYSFAALSMILVGMMGVVVLIVFQDVTINNESDYYSIKEAMEASMVEAIDKSYYAQTGELKIVEQKFVVNFTRRFIGNSIGASEGYTLEFYDIMESPPKATVIIYNSTDLLIISEDNANIVNNLTAILEGYVHKNVVLNSDAGDKYYCAGTIKTGTKEYTEYYSNVPKGDNAKYLLNSETIKNLIGRNDIINLRVSEIKNITLLNGTKSINLSGAYKYYKNNNRWAAISNATSNKTGVETDTCYTAGVQVSIVDAYGSNNSYKFPEVEVITRSNDSSSSGCPTSNNNTLVKYTVVWKYDYCDS